MNLLSASSYSDDHWNVWTAKSRHVLFKSNQTAIGDGEQKLAAEFDVTPLGQNVSHDLEVNGEKWEVKKMDSDHSFRLGVEVSSNYRVVINSVLRILECVLNLEEELVDSQICETIKGCIERIKSTSGQSRTPLLDGLRKNEVSESNLNKANDIIETLKHLVIYEEEKIDLFTSHDGSTKKYDSIIAYRKLSLESITVQEKVAFFGDLNKYCKVLLTSSIINDLRIFKEISLREKLNSIIREVFSEIKLVLVHKNYGFRPVSDLSYIYCNRITSGNPRCKLRL